jgi:hypothetical protein
MQLDATKLASLFAAGIKSALSPFHLRLKAVEERPLPKDGKDGRDGIDGKDGAPGAPGMAGERGPEGPAGPARRER